MCRRHFVRAGKPRWLIRLRHCATSRKVAGSVADNVTAIFRWTLSFLPYYDPGVDSAANGNEYQEYFLEGKGGWCVGPTTLPPSYADCHEICEPQPPGTLRAYSGLHRDCFTFSHFVQLENWTRLCNYIGQQRFWLMRKNVCFWCIFGRWIRIYFLNFSITHTFRSTLKAWNLLRQDIMVCILPWAPWRVQGFLLPERWCSVSQWCLFRYGSSWPWM